MENKKTKVLAQEYPVNSNNNFNIKEMANWASTSYCIEGSENELRKIFNVIEDFMKEKRKSVEQNASEEWEGNIVKALGATKEQMEKYYLRGFIEEYEMKDNIVSIEAEEAWGLTNFRDLLKQLIPNITIYYLVIETDDNVFATNDTQSKYFSERFYVDSFINGDYYSEYFSTEKETMKYIAKILEKKEISKEELENWKKEHKDSEEYISIHECAIVE